MNGMFKCPMMCGMQPDYRGDQPFMEPELPVIEDSDLELHYADEEDDRRFMKMYPESCKKMMVFIKIEVDKMEELDEMIHDDQPDRDMINIMAENAYNAMVKEMPEMAEEERQYQGRRFTRDLLRILLLNELFRRRRRRRRSHLYGYNYY